ncbi:MBL fold metallo-hydrolase [Bacteroides acidifaciens]|uniref:MBL fold metallo-hydrolase n=1 Tax=Bacteroides acidifaciens TaxID=85831 RepID=UPI0025AA2752|nr:hypothetical protein [Bacteroides acidifaciens]
MKVNKWFKINTLGFVQSINWFFLLLCSFTISACNSVDDPTPESPKPQGSQAETVMNELWKTSCLLPDKSARIANYNTIQSWADICPSDNVFLKYIKADEVTAVALANSYSALKCYDLAFDRVLNALKAGLPTGASPRVWALYNMGIVVQTHKGNYAVDVYHRRGSELAPYIDFYAITHIHADHKWEPLAIVMSELGKPVLTNFAINGVNNGQYFSKVGKDYTIGEFKIHSFITHHNSSDLATLAITAFYVDGGGLKLLHSGDSNFIAEEFETMRDKEVDYYVFRYAVNSLTENNVLGNIVNPKVAVLSHILELGHKDIANSRWSLELGLDRAGRLNCRTVAMPFWGDYISM